MEKKKQRFSLRKNKIGAMSVLLGISFVGAVASGSDVKANEISEEKAPKLIEKEVVGKTTEQDVAKAKEKVATTKVAKVQKETEVNSKSTELEKATKEVDNITKEV